MAAEADLREYISETKSATEDRELLPESLMAKDGELFSGGEKKVELEPQQSHETGETVDERGTAPLAIDIEVDKENATAEPCNRETKSESFSESLSVLRGVSNKTNSTSKGFKDAEIENWTAKDTSQNESIEEEKLTNQTAEAAKSQEASPVEYTEEKPKESQKDEEGIDDGDADKEKSISQLNTALIEETVSEKVSPVEDGRPESSSKEVNEYKEETSIKDEVQDKDEDAKFLPENELGKEEIREAEIDSKHNESSEVQASEKRESHGENKEIEEPYIQETCKQTEGDASVVEEEMVDGNFKAEKAQEQEMNLETEFTDCDTQGIKGPLEETRKKQNYNNSARSSVPLGSKEENEDEITEKEKSAVIEETGSTEVEKVENMKPDHSTEHGDPKIQGSSEPSEAETDVNIAAKLAETYNISEENSIPIQESTEIKALALEKENSPDEKPIVATMYDEASNTCTDDKSTIQEQVNSSKTNSSPKLTGKAKITIYQFCLVHE